MREFESKLLDVRVELVTAAFVASGAPEGVHDLARFLEMLNNDAVSRYVELASPAVRPLYRASDQLHLDVPLLVRRDEIIFATFEGPSFVRSDATPRVDAPVLLLAPPFQIQGTASVPPGAIVTQALRPALQGFFAVRNARVFDTEGAALGEGEQIIVNGAAVQMTSSTEQHIAAAAGPRARELAVIESDAAADDAPGVRAA